MSDRRCLPIAFIILVASPLLVGGLAGCSGDAKKDVVVKLEGSPSPTPSPDGKDAGKEAGFKERPKEGGLTAGGGKEVVKDDGKKEPKKVVVAGSDQEEWERKLRLLEAEVNAAHETRNPLVIEAADKKLMSYVAGTLTAGRDLNGWVGILSQFQRSHTDFWEIRGGKKVPLPPQPCVTAKVLLRDFKEGGLHVGGDPWPALKITTADRVTKSILTKVEEQFADKRIADGRMVRVWGRIQPPDGVATSEVATVLVIKIEPFDPIPGREPTLKLIAEAESDVTKLRKANQKIAGIEFNPVVDDDGTMGLIPRAYPSEYKEYIGVAAKHPDFRAAVLSFNAFWPRDADPEALRYLSTAKTRLENARLLNEKKEHDDVKVLAEKLKKASLEAEQQVDNLKTIDRCTLLARPSKYLYRELPAEIRKETDRDKYAFVPCAPSDRKRRPAPVPHEDAAKAVPEPAKDSSKEKGVPKDPGKTADEFQAKSVWIGDTLSHTLTVLERKGDTFRALFTSSAFSREVSGTVKDGKVSWLRKDVRSLKGGPGGDNEGTIRGDTIDFVWRDISGATGKFSLRLKRAP